MLKWSMICGIGLLCYVVLTSDSEAHGSSHPRWSHEVDDKGVEYMRCSGYLVSQVPYVYEHRILTHFFKPDELREYKWSVDRIVAFAEFGKFIKSRGALCRK
jgi:hypothetical protein